MCDMSGTINSASATVSGPSQVPEGGAAGIAVGIDPAMRDLVVEETLSVQRALEVRMKKMIQDEMVDIRRAVNELSTAVKSLANVRPQQNESVNTRRVEGISNHESSNWSMENTRDNPFRNVPLEFPIGDGITPPTQRPTTSVHNILNLPYSRNEARSQTSGNQNIANSISAIIQQNNTPEIAMPNNVNRTGDKILIRVDKWGLTFNGNSTHMSVEDFIFRLEHLQAHYDVLWEEILRDFHLLVTGPAKDWYWLMIRTHGVMKWPTLRCELLNQYRNNSSNFEIMRDLVERKQQPQETIDAFFYAMNKLRSRLVQAIPEYDMIKIMKRNVKENVAKIVYPIAVSSVEQLRLECNEAERNFPRREMRINFLQRPVRAVNEVRFVEPNGREIDESSDISEEIAAIRDSQHQQRIQVCYGIVKRKDTDFATARMQIGIIKRQRNIKFIPVQEVYRRNTILSDFSKNINAKFCKKFVKSRGFHMFLNGTDLKLARKLLSLTDHRIKNLQGNEKLDLIRNKIRLNMHESYERNANRYYKRARNIKFIPVQEVYRRNTILSDFS
ncbi:hypothetical protein CVS40_9620 [Lucilia cuprina]|nr:hypothetical protein CVS40_9620 [Lucilia cuprina]